MAERLGILGGGQLGRMLALAARPLGLSVSVLEPNPDAPARAAADHIWAEYDDPDGLARLAECDTITFEFENIPEVSAQALQEHATLHPAPRALRVSQDRWTEKNAFADLGIATARFSRVDTEHDVREAWSRWGAVVLKTRRFGYDGKGQAVVRDEASIATAFASLKGAPAIAEELVSFDRELSIVLCRGRAGEVVTYPVVQNVHREGILRTTVAPAPELPASLADSAVAMATRLAESLDYVGVLALELFEVEGKLIANEFAPRVHNSGHWSIEGAVTSQFENHVRAVCGLPLGDASLRCPAVMTNFIGNVPDHSKVLGIRDTHLHDYDKASREGRKVGHATSLGKTPEEARERARQVEALLQEA